MLSVDEKDYSDYIKHLSNLIGILSLFSGFMFTAYTILITRLPDPSSITAQFTLYVLSTFLNVFLFCLAYFVATAFYCCRNVPPFSKRAAFVNSLFLASVTAAMHVTVVIMSLLWNLTYLAFVQALQGILVVMAGYLFIIRPFWRYRKSKSSE